MLITGLPMTCRRVRSACMRAALALLMLVTLGSGSSRAQPIAIAARTAPDTDAVRALALPLTAVPSTVSGNRLALLITGDGGFVEADRRLAAALAQRGLSVVALDARAYLSHKRTPEEAARDASRIIRAYMGLWQRGRIVLIGYSRGADIMAFIANRMEPDLRSRVDLIAFLGLAPRASFEFHWKDLLFDTSRPTDLPVLPELERLRGQKMLCVYGADERDPLCKALDAALMHVVARDGSHRIGAKDAPDLAQLIVRALR